MAITVPNINEKTAQIPVVALDPTHANVSPSSKFGITSSGATN